MQRLRHPIRAIREPFGTAGLIVAMIALVAALGGTALAASKLNSTQKKEVEKIAKKYAGKPGVDGSGGAAGTKGEAGTPGAPGAPGAPGKGVVLANGNSGCRTNGGAGGTSVEVEGSGTKKFICNGTPGAIQPEETLPSEATETGVWTFGPLPEASFVGHGAVTVAVASFAIPLAEPLDANHVHYVNPEGKELVFNANEFEVEVKTPTECSTSAATPTAAPGNFCLYAASEEFTTPGFLFPGGGNSSIFNPATNSAGAFSTGAIAFFRHKGEVGEGDSKASGTWAVTAP